MFQKTLIVSSGKGWALFGALLLPALVAVGCGPGEDPPGSLECGEGTENRNGTCVAVIDAIDSCGEGTIFDDTTGKCEPTIRCGDGTQPNEAGECVPTAECGPGTELDLSTGQCIPVASCGPGTVLDEATGECVSEAACGAGTVLEDGECVAVGTCAPGSVLNLDTGLCESDTECGPGQIIANGQCADPNVAVGLEADTLESVPENNDPLFGGTPEALTLEAIGEETVFVGNIGRPADLGGNGVLTQDRDAWGFTGTTGQYLKISVLGTGLPQPAFIVEGPRGYRRVSPLLSTNDTSREVVLPYDGEYIVIVVPTAFVSTSLPLGSTSSGYVGVIEELARPTPKTLVPASDPTLPLEESGNLRDLSDNFFLLDADVGDAVSLIFKEANPAIPPAILAFDASGKLLTHVDLDLSKGAWVGTLVKEEPGTTVVVDWQTSTTANDAFTLQVAEIPHVQGGTAPANGAGATSPTSILGESVGAFTVVVPSPLLLFWDIDDTTAPDLQLQNDNGTYAIVYDDAESFFYAEPSTYTFFVFNDGTAEDDAAALLYETVTPTELGPFDPSNPTTESASGDLLSPDPFGPRSAWMVVHTTAPSLVRLTPEIELGAPSISLYDLAGNLQHSFADVRYETPVHALSSGAPLLVELSSGSSLATFDWSVGATALPLPQQLDVEPNDVGSNAGELGALPASTVGTLSADAIDMYQFTLDAPLLPGQAIEVQLENLNGTSSFGDDAYITIYDELNQALLTSELYFPDVNLRAYVVPAETQSSSTFYVEILEFGYDDTDQYLLSVRVVDQPTENEPNETRENADAADSLPITWAGNWSSTDTLDWFSFTLDDNLGFTELLRVRLHNVSSSNPSTLVLEDEAGTVVATYTSTTGAGSDIELLLPLLSAGQYFLSVEGPSYAINYRLTVEVMTPPPMELEPNDTAQQASSLGEVTANSAPYLFGTTTNSDEDWLSFTLANPLAEGEGIALRCLNPLDSTSLDCELYDLTDVGAPLLLGAVRDDEAALRTTTSSAGPFGVRVVGTASSSDMWYVRAEIGASGGDVEPNNDIATAQLLGSLGAGDVLTGSGSVTSSDQDCFSFTLGGAFPAGDSVRVNFTNKTSTSDILVNLYDASNPGVVLSYEDDDFGVLISGQTGSSTYAVCFEGTSATAQHSYDFTIDAGPRAEVEPNDLAATANELGALPASIQGVIGNTAADVYKFTLASDLGPTEAVEITFKNLSDTTSWDVSLRPAGDTSRPQQLDDDEGVVLSALGLAAGSYEIQVDGKDSTSTSTAAVSDLYQIDVRVVGTP